MNYIITTDVIKMSSKELESNVKCLYIRLPIKIKNEQQIKDLHPDIIEVQLRRKDKFRFCYIVFEDHEKCVKAFKLLKKVKINGKKICVKFPFGKRKLEPFKKPIKFVRSSE